MYVREPVSRGKRPWRRFDISRCKAPQRIDAAYDLQKVTTHALPMQNLTSLDNPIWSALTTAQAPMARIAGLACRYASDVSPFAAFASPSIRAFEDLSALVDQPGESVALFGREPLEISDDWRILRNFRIDQMICPEQKIIAAEPAVRLTTSDVPEMLALTAATQPGPFLPNTIQMGSYYGIRSTHGRLISMAGMRLQMQSFIEISAVCTHPAFRGQGHARSLISTLIAQISAAGKTPFLHVAIDNPAKHLYHSLGFIDHGPICVTVIAKK